MPKASNGRARDIILSVLAFNEKEKHKNGPILTYENVVHRTAVMTGVSIRTVYRIKAEVQPSITKAGPSSTGHEHQSDDSSTSKPVGTSNSDSTAKVKNPRKQQTPNLVEVDIKSIRRRLQQYYLNDTVPTLTRLHRELRRDNNFKGSYEMLKKILHDLGFKYKQIKRGDNKESCKTPTSTQVIIDPLEEQQSLVTAVKIEPVGDHTDVGSQDRSYTEHVDNAGIDVLKQPVSVKIEMEDNHHEREQDDTTLLLRQGL